MNPIVDTLVGLGGKVLDRVLPDEAARAEAKLKLLELAQTGELAQLNADTELAKAQIELNGVEAQSENLFKSGWRPAVGWVCVGGLAYQVVVRPLFGWAAANWWGWTPPPSLEMDTLGTILFGMLGLGAYRTYEKVARK